MPSPTIFWKDGVKPVTSVGELLYADRVDPPAYSGLAGVAAGQILQSGGVNTAPIWSSSLDISSATGGQIKFPATANPSSDANTLDDYEEGTWTVTDQSGASLSLTTNKAIYVKVGRAVFIFFDVSFPVTANGSNILLGGFPFAAGGYNAALTTAYQTIPAGTVIQWLKNDDLVNPATLGGSSYVNSQFSNSRVMAAGTYQSTS